MSNPKELPFYCHLIWFVSILAFIILGCSSNGSTSTAPATPLPPAEIPFIQETPQDILTAIVTSPSTPHINPTSTLSLPSSAVTPSLTLSTEEARTQIAELLLTNGNCRLPCLWGMIPGKTTQKEAETFLMPFTGSAKNYSFDYRIGGLLWIQESADLKVHLGVDYYLNSIGTIEKLYFRAEAYDISQGIEKSRRTYTNPVFNQEFQAYMLPQILSNYGPPEEVFISTASKIPAPNSWWPFYVFLLYPEQGIFIDYVVGLERVEDKVIGCPAHAHMTLWLLQPGHENYPELLGGNWTPFFEEPSYYKTITEAAAMTIEVFYQVFKNPDNTTCLETPAALWGDPTE